MWRYTVLTRSKSSGGHFFLSGFRLVDDEADLLQPSWRNIYIIQKHKFIIQLSFNRHGFNQYKWKKYMKKNWKRDMFYLQTIYLSNLYKRKVKQIHRSAKWSTSQLKEFSIRHRFLIKRNHAYLHYLSVNWFGQS